MFSFGSEMNWQDLQDTRLASALESIRERALQPENLLKVRQQIESQANKKSTQAWQQLAAARH